ncbi:hypothetical protein L484_002309 [Morus notabilis]|uniref:Uncharacterized protein n=1 Tax=Morus notabilis TaxID=981085 RepID=W9RY53_9ROSA|nr:hypothetical protein L484_002309 [Morus notabilis]
MGERVQNWKIETSIWKGVLVGNHLLAQAPLLDACAYNTRNNKNSAILRDFQVFLIS